MWVIESCRQGHNKKREFIPRPIDVIITIVVRKQKAATKMTPPNVDPERALQLDDIQVAAAVKSEQRSAEQQRLSSKAEILAAFKPELLQKVNEHMQMLEQMDHKKADLCVFKQEMLEKVQNHVEDLERLNTKQADLAVFKDELLAKVSSHLEDLEKAHHAAADLAKFKEELLEKVSEHVEDMDRAVAKREEVAKFRSEMMEKAASLRAVNGGETVEA